MGRAEDFRPARFSLFISLARAHDGLFDGLCKKIRIQFCLLLSVSDTESISLLAS